MAASKPVRSDLAAPTAFVLRTPLLPRDELDRWGADLASPDAADAELDGALARDRETLRARLRAIVLRPEVREAIFVASPNLDASIDAWLAAPSSEAGLRTERGLVRYVSRMAARPTPFGLFAGNTVGVVGDTTELALAPRADYRRYTRLDGDYLANLTDALGADPAIRDALRYRPNSSLCAVAGRLRYAMRTEGGMRAYSLVSLEPSDYLLSTLALARDGALPAALAAALVEADPEVARDEADDFVAELISTQILVSDLAPPVTGAEAVDDVIAQLATLASPLAATTGAALARSRAAMQALDAGLGHTAAPYRAVAEALAALPVPVDLSRLFQVNLVPVATAATLGRDVVDEITRGIALLRRLARPRAKDDLARFREAFEERYESREIPLVEVLDEESGIGFAVSTAPGAHASPLLDGLPFPAGAGEETLAWGVAASHLLRRVGEATAAGVAELVLDEADLDAMASETPAEAHALGVMVSLAGPPAAGGGLEVLLDIVTGPPGATFLGRFCHSDPALLELVRAHLAAEEALQPHALFAEIVHLADGRLANISARPVLRGHEIVFLGRSAAPRENQIEVGDLAVSVRGGRVVLRSMRLGREIVPRLTNAHNFSNRSLGTYRFLATLQHQDQRRIAFGATGLDALPYVPRIRHGRVILRAAQWRILGTALAPLIAAKDGARVRAMRTLRTQLGLPRWICIEDGDHVLPVDLDNALALDSFAHLVRGKGVVHATELWPESSRLVARGPDGGYANELVVPFVRVTPVETRPAPPPALGAPRPVPRRFAPGSEWLYAKLYTGNATADQVLEAIAPVTADLPAWFFIRYGDPQWHLRLRVHGEPRWLLGEVAPRLTAALQPLLDDGRVYRVQYDTYEREVERYGGPRGIDLAERWFHADSVAVLAILGQLSGDAGIDARWRLAVRGVDQLLGDLGFELQDRLAIMRTTRDLFAREHRVEKLVPFQRKLGDRYRAERARLEGLLDPAQDAASDFAPALAAFAARSRATAPIVAELRAAERAGLLSVRDLAPSYAHMHANRLLRSVQRPQELVIYDLLARLYESRLARAKQPRST